MPSGLSIAAGLGVLVAAAGLFAFLAMRSARFAKARPERVEAAVVRHYAGLLRDRGFRATWEGESRVLEGEADGRRVRIDVWEQKFRGVLLNCSVAVPLAKPVPARNGLRLESERLGDGRVATLRAAATEPNRVTRADTAALGDAAMAACGEALATLGGAIVAHKQRLAWYARVRDVRAAGEAQIAALVALARRLEAG
jgi:hypothetical protein